MPGIKGQIQRVSRRDTARNKMWTSMRILRRFSLPDICRTSGAKEDNARKYIRRLAVHGIVACTEDSGGKGFTGLYHAYRLVRDTGPHHPVLCDLCGRPVTEECRKNEG